GDDRLSRRMDRGESAHASRSRRRRAATEGRGHRAHGGEERVKLPQGVTLRALISGFVLSLLLCAINSYLTLSFGVIEEGPTIAALFFFAMFFLSKQKITTTEMVIVSTM